MLNFITKFLEFPQVIKKTGGFSSDRCCYPKGAKEGTKRDPKE
jgi:hypothetical protein